MVNSWTIFNMAKDPKKEEVKKEFRQILRIYNTDVDSTKSVMIALTKIKGIGPSFANGICNVLGIDKKAIVGNLPEDVTKKMDDVIANPKKYGFPTWMLNRISDYETGEDTHLLLSDLDLTKDNDIKRQKKIKSYKGIRHMRGLPVRGQRTKSNFRRNKGKVTGVKKK